MHLMETDSARNDELILVDGSDKQIATATKLQAHVDGLLHRAFSVLLVREGADGLELLLAKRSKMKYHSADLWANSCCSHPRAGEGTIDAAYRRVHEELGCEAQNLREIAAFAYRAVFDNGITEYEYDHVLVGTFAGALDLDPNEVSETRWVRPDELVQELVEQPDHFAAWAYTVFTLVMQNLETK